MRVIERRSYSGDYGMTGTEAIIDHPDHGRLYIRNGFGGKDQLRGGMIRWEHGTVCRLLPTDTFASLAEAHNDYGSVLSAMLAGQRDDRPVLDWSGHAVEAVAIKAGL